MAGFDPRAYAAEDDEPFDPNEYAKEDQPRAQRTGLQSFMLNALDSASVIGLDKALALGDTIKEVGSDAPGSFNERYHRHLKEMEPVRQGMSDDQSEHPVATITGQLAPALLTGKLSAKFAPVGPTTFKGVVKQGAALGAMHGYFGGKADTSGGDLEGTAIDTAAGAAGGALGSAAGAVGGKAIEWIGNKAANRLDSEITKRIASLLGVYGQKKKDAYQAIKNLKVQENMPINPGAAQTPAGVVMNRIRNAFPRAEQDLERASAGNAMKEVRRFTGSQNRFNNVSGIPSKRYAGEVALRTMRSESKQNIRDAFEALVRVGSGASAGRAIAPASDFLNKRSGAAFGAAIAGGGPLWAVRKLTTAIMGHPDVLEKMGTRLPGLGKALQRVGGNSGAVAGYVASLLMTPAGQEAAWKSAVESGVFDAGAEDEGPFKRFDVEMPDGSKAPVYGITPETPPFDREARKKYDERMRRKTLEAEGYDPNDESI